LLRAGVEGTLIVAESEVLAGVGARQVLVAKAIATLAVLRRGDGGDRTEEG
jgi:hypothetical protein